MKNTILFIFTILFYSLAQGQTIQKFYLDFGPNDKTNGNITASPDANGNSWNNITAASTIYSLYNSENKLSQFTFIVNAPLSFNGIQNGGLLAPEKEKLGDFAVPTATQDYMYATTPARMTIRNLNISNGYKFYFFGSRDNAGTRKTNFVVSGSNIYSGSLQTSGLNLGGANKNMNNSTIFVTDTIRPDINGEIRIDMSPGTGGFAYLNAMKFEGINITDITSITIKGNNIYIPNDSSQMTATISPSFASPKPITWSIDDSTKATILNNGMLIAKQNGIVKVTATIIQNGSPMSATTEIIINNQLSESSALQKIFVDFGPNDQTNGNATPNPSRGNFWNNITPRTPQISLINSTNQNTGFTLIENDPVIGFSGILNGGYLTPDTTQLGEMAVPSATQDYIFTVSSGQLKLGGLNKNKGYRFFIFGSRDTSTPRKSLYTLSGLNNCSGTLQTSGVDIGGRGFNYNRNNFYVSELVLPDNNGEISIQLTASANSPAHINMMKVEEFDIFPPTQIEITDNSVNEPYSISRLGIIFSPANATPLNTQWSVNDTTIATITPKGIINAKQNGKVIVTANCLLPNGQLLSTSKEINISNQLVDLFVDGDVIIKDRSSESSDGGLVMKKAFGANGILKGVFELTTTLKPSGSLLFYASKAESNTVVIGEGDAKGLICVNGKKIVPSIQGEAYIRVNLIKKTYEIIPIDTTKITLIGSSVQYGVGATNFHGWFYLYSQTLGQRYLLNYGGKWNTSNVSILGNNTLNVLDRWDTDLLNEGSRYVIIGLSLGNEGIIGGGQPVFDQFRKNIGILINKARSQGKYPVLINCYGRNDYTLSEYNYTKQMDLIIHQLDVPSINILGALDNGSGGCPSLYMNDTMHPNDIGHAELSYNVVPSLFDALRNKKKIPQKVTNTYLSAGREVTSETFTFTPENTIHSFTLSFDYRSSSSGIICTFSQIDSLGIIRINDGGFLVYKSPNGGQIIGSQNVNDGNWHKITLTHYYAQGITYLYSDSVQSGSINEKLLAQTFYLHNKLAPAYIDYKDWMIYRAGMTSDEILELNRGKLLKSSLELYAPLDGLSVISSDTLINLAQSMNKIKRMDLSTKILENKFEQQVKIFPNPVVNILKLKNLDPQKEYFYKIISLNGKDVYTTSFLYKNELELSKLPSQKYILLLYDKHKQSVGRFEFIKK